MNLHTLSDAAPDISSLGARRRGAILATCCLSLFIVGVDVTGLNVALPSISADLGASGSQLQWVVDAYTLVLASLLLLSGSIGDRFGRRRVFLLGLVLFSSGSVLCSLAMSPGMLIVSRMLQAVGGSMLNPVAMSIVTNTFTDPKERARAIGMWGAAFGLSMALGPVLGGALVDTLGWRSMFWLNVPVCLAAITLTLILVPDSRAERARRPDPGAQTLIVILLATVTYAIIEGRGLGWTSAVVVGCFAAALVSLIALITLESHRREPMIDPRFFRSIPFSSSVVTAILAFSAMGGFLFLNTLYLQEVRHLAPLHAGLMTLPMAGVMAVLAPVSGRLVGNQGPRLPMVLAGAATAVAGIMLTQVQPDTSYAYLVAAYVVLGIGSGLVNAPITNAAVSGMPRAQAGVASGVASVSRQIGTSLDVAIFGAVAFGHVGGDLSQAAVPAWIVLAACGIGVAVVGFAATGRSARSSAVRVSQTFEPNARRSGAPS